MLVSQVATGVSCVTSAVVAKSNLFIRFDKDSPTTTTTTFSTPFIDEAGLILLVLELSFFCAGVRRL